MSPEAIAIAALESIAQSGDRADRVLKRALRANRHLSNAERAAVASGVHGVRCFEGRLRYRLAGLGLPVDARHQLAAFRIDIQQQQPADVVERLSVSADLEALRADGPWPSDPVERLAAERSLPRWLAEAWHAERSDADALAAAMNVPGPVTIRANSLRNQACELREILAAEGIESTPTALAADGLHLHGGPDIRGSAAYRAGRFEVQDQGSQRIAEALGARPGETIVDLCAGAGGKTLALAAAMADRGRLVAADVDRARLGDLRARLTRVPLASVEVCPLAPDWSAADLPLADRILVDAPCSALGTLRRGPDHRWRISAEAAAAFAPLQRSILQRAASRLKPGGRLVYATCTLLHAENRDVVAALSSSAPWLEPSPVFEGEGLVDAVELTPNVHGTDGFFIAAFVRAGP